jgi:phenylpropionate dioxygenase-like ring-hydroxylating dioxygenase large terminal subunit
MPARTASCRCRAGVFKATGSNAAITGLPSTRSVSVGARRARTADPAKIFPIPEWSDPAWGRNSGDTKDVECHYLYVTDNLLDPSHVAWVHQSSIADTASANVPVDIHANANGSGLAVTRWTRELI